MKYRRLLLILSALMFTFLFVDVASAWSTNIFNNSASSDNLTFSTILAERNLTRYVAIPSGKILINSNINYSQLDSPFYSTFNYTYVNGIDQNFSVGANAYYPSTIKIFNYKGTRHMIVTNSSDYNVDPMAIVGYTWNGTKWNVNATMTNGLSNVYYFDLFSLNDNNTFYSNNSLNMISANFATNSAFMGWTFNGTGWSSNSSLIAGLSTVTASYKQPSLFYYNNTWNMLEFDGEFGGVGQHSWAWNGTAWVENNLYNHGIGSNQNTKGQIILDQGRLIYLGYEAGFVAKVWNGTSFVSKDISWTTDYGNSGYYFPNWDPQNRVIYQSMRVVEYVPVVRIFKWTDSYKTTNPSNLTTYVGTNIAYFSNSYSASQQKSISNLTSKINTYLAGCTYVGGYCNVPITFNSIGYLDLSSLNFDNLGFTENSQTFNVSSYPSAVETYGINLTYDSGEFPTITADLIYNGTTYAGTKTGSGNTVTFSRSIIIPPTLSGSQVFYWKVNITNSTGSTSTYYSTNQTQSLGSLTPPAISAGCGAGYNATLIFNSFDEANLSRVNISTDYNLIYGYGTMNYSIYGTISNANLFYLCINATQPSYNIAAELQYSAPSYVPRRYYIFNNTRLTNAPINISLYNLLSSVSTTFKVPTQTNSLIPYQNKYLGLLRWYPNLNQYQTVDMALTDGSGNGVLHVVTENVDYRVGLYELNGSLIKLNSPTRFLCLTQPCTYAFTVFPSDQDYTSVTGIEQSLTFNSSTNKFIYIWNDPSQRTQTMNLTVYRETGLNVGSICESIGSGSTGAINCDVTGYNGQLRAVVFRSASPAVPIASLTENLGQAISSIVKDMGLIIAMILAVIGFFVGIFNPFIGIILQIAALIPSLYLGSVPLSLIIGFAIMGVVVIHFMKRAMGG